MAASVTDPSGYGVWEPRKDLKTGKIYWTNHALQKTAWEPPKGSTAVIPVEEPGVVLAVAPLWRWVRGVSKPSGDSNQQHQLLSLQRQFRHLQVMGTHSMLHTQAATRATGTRQILATTTSMQQQAMRRSKRPALLLTSKCEISTEAAQAGTTTIVEAKAVETRKGVGRETDTIR